ncbi:MAG: hypothetical protein GF331_21780, partial [Chitinivibrionales bacterium]|nr:hypothetical protein [Chitinivibrionales bacterium]
MRGTGTSTIIAALVACLLIGQAHAATVTINEQVEHQTIEGFGAHGSMDVWWSNGPFYNDQWLNLVVNDLGLSMTRNEYYPRNEKAGIQKPFLQALHSKAQSSGMEVRFIFTVWSPPGAWKWCPNDSCPDRLWNRLSNGVGPSFDIEGNPIAGLGSEYGGLPNRYP